jgi:hypothetical protein
MAFMQRAIALANNSMPLVFHARFSCHLFFHLAICPSCTIIACNKTRKKERESRPLLRRTRENKKKKKKSEKTRERKERKRKREKRELGQEKKRRKREEIK